MKQLLLAFLCLALTPLLTAQTDWINWESPPVHPIDITPDGTLLVAVNTADGQLEVDDISTGVPIHLASISVGIDPVSVRVRNDSEAWVINRISDSVSIVDLDRGTVTWTILVADEPADVIFAGNPERAFISCSGTDTLLVIDPADLSSGPIAIPIFGEEPRALARSVDGSKVYLAIFESGNNTTILGGGIVGNGLGMGVLAYPPNVVSDPNGPYGGLNPPPNSGSNFDPPINGANGAPPPVGLIVKRLDEGIWVDDNGTDWGDLVSGADASLSGRPVNWDLADHDIAVIDTATLSVSYIRGLMNIGMAIGVNPADGRVTLVGTDAINEVRFEPLVRGIFVRSNLALVDPAAPTASTVVDLNGHLDYSTGDVPQDQRDLSLGDPRAIVWNQAGTIGYVCGKGSNNIVVIDSNGARLPGIDPIEVGEGPSGLVLDEARGLLYVHEHFAGSVSAVDTTTLAVVATLQRHDSTPDSVRLGRPFLYDTHLTSGLGQASCASCHVDSRLDRLSWDLGDPAGSLDPFDQNCHAEIGDLGFPVPDCEDWHPMKGPMLTQTLQDIIGKEPHHWRGDRDGLEEFAPAFAGLLGDDTALPPDDMQKFEDFLATIHYPPNPFRNIDNSLPAALSLDGHYTPGRFAPEGEPLGIGDAVRGLDIYRNGTLDTPFQCVTCHTLPTGIGPDMVVVGLPPQYVDIPPGPNGERHNMVVSTDGSSNVTIKVPQLRNLYKRTGFDTSQTLNTSGFGYVHDGSVDTIARFVSEPVFQVQSDQDIADLVAFMLAFSGSDLPQGNAAFFFEPPGRPGLDAHAAVGIQITFDGSNNNDGIAVNHLFTLELLAINGKIGLIAKGLRDGTMRGWAFSAGEMLSDRAGEVSSVTDLYFSSGPGTETTFTAVVLGSEVRLGIDRDSDGYLDGDEFDSCSDPADAGSIPVPGGCGSSFIRTDCNGDLSIDISDAISALDRLFAGIGPAPCIDACDSNDDGAFDIADPTFVLLHLFGGGVTPAAPFPDCGGDPTPDSLACASPACP